MFLNSSLGRRIDESSPMVDARLPDGSRVNALIPPLAVDGPTITIRRFSKKPFSAGDLVDNKTIVPSTEPSATATTLPTSPPTIPLPSPTATPRPPTILPAPTLIGPGDGTKLVRGQVVTLRWDWTGELGSDKWFSVLMRCKDQESFVEIARVTSNEYSLNEPPDSKYGHCCWKVVVVREVAGEAVPVSEPSEEQNFWWLWSRGISTPTPRH